MIDVILVWKEKKVKIGKKKIFFNLDPKIFKCALKNINLEI